MAILITGGAGFIGSNLMEKLLSLGKRVVCLDNFDDFYSSEIKKRNIKECQKNASCQIINGDIRDKKCLDDLFSENKIDFVIHLAARAGVRPSIINPVLYADVNVMGTLSLLESMNKFKVDKLIFASSSSVYGNNLKIPFNESDRVDFPISPYAATKKSAELLTYSYHHLYNLSVINFRFFTVYGPRQRPDLAIHKFFYNLYSGLPIEIFGDGNTGRDYTYIDDIIDGIIKGMDFLQHRTKSIYEIINLGNNRPVLLKELIKEIELVADKTFEKVNSPLQQGDVNQTFADISKAKKMLNYLPETGMHEGLKKFKVWFLEHNRINITE